IAHETYEIIQALTGAAIAGLCLYRHHTGWPEKQSLNGTLALASTWMLVLGPATESCTYIIMAPVLAASVVKALYDSAWSWRKTMPFAGCGFFALAIVLGTLPHAGDWHSWGMHPVGGLLFLAYLLTEPRPRVQETEGQFPLPAAA